MNIFISGGCKNGKSMHAQELARDMAREKNVPLYYLATMIPADDEDRARIRRHLSEREGWGFDTVEQGRDICGCLLPQARTVSGMPVNPGGVFLLDSVTALLSNEMFPPDGPMDLAVAERLADELTEFALQTGNISSRVTRFGMPAIFALRNWQSDLLPYVRCVQYAAIAMVATYA